MNIFLPHRLPPELTSDPPVDLVHYTTAGGLKGMSVRSTFVKHPSFGDLWAAGPNKTNNNNP